MPGLAYQKTVAYCELLSTTLKPQLEGLPHLKDESESLDTLIVELKNLDSQQQALKARLQEITRLRQEAERRGRSLRSRIAAQLQGKLGFANENLLAFGSPPANRAAAVPRPRRPPPRKTPRRTRRRPPRLPRSPPRPADAAYVAGRQPAEASRASAAPFQLWAPTLSRRDMKRFAGIVTTYSRR
ncbi:MAG TPA: hypothetical protein VF756_02575 [Thermoanaerobaculia bacterium]